MTSLSYFRLLQNAVVTGALGLGKQFCLNRQFSEVVWTEMCLQQAFFFFWPQFPTLKRSVTVHHHNLS